MFPLPRMRRFLGALLFLLVLTSPETHASAFKSASLTSGITKVKTISLGSAPSRPLTRSCCHHHTPMKSSVSSSSNLMFSLPSLLFLRGGQQDEETVTSDDMSSLEVDASAQRQYGTNGALGDEESSPSASVELPTRSSIEPKADSSLPDQSQGNTKPCYAVVLTPLASVLRSVGSFYSSQLTSRPIITKSVTAGIIFGLSDWCAQLIELRGSRDEDNKSMVYSRTLTSFLVGLLYFGPAASAWYSTMFRLLPSTSLISTLQKATLGQIIFGPILTCIFFGAFMIEGGTFTIGAWIEKIQSDLPAAWAAGLGFWPMVDFISYKVIPVDWIPLFVNFCSFVWTIYLSLVSNKPKTADE